MFEVLDQRARPQIGKRRRLLRLPHSAHDVLIASLTTLTQRSASRSWTLPATSFPDEVAHYSTRHKAISAEGPRPRLHSSLSKACTEELAVKIHAALHFAELAETADPLIKPILLYYAFAHLCGVYTRAFFEWECDSRTHGLKCTPKPGNLQNTEIKVQHVGQFPRLAVTCFLLTARPNFFSPLVTYSAKPTARTGPGQLLETFGQNEKGLTIPKLTLDDLVNFDYGNRLKTVRQHHGFHKFKGLPTTALLVDAMTLFVGSYLARYDVIGWQQILEGRNNRYIIHFEETFDRFLTFTIDALLAALENPILDFDNRLIPSQPSPYSHHDHSRFKNDPNYEP